MRPPPPRAAPRRPAPRVAAALVAAAVAATAASPRPRAAPPAAGTPAVDPDTLVVAPPEPIEERHPTDDINKLLRTELSMLEAMEELDKDIARRSDELARLQKQEQVVEADLARMAARFDGLTDDVERARRLVRKRLRALIQLQRTEPYQLLFAAESYGAFLRRTRALKKLVASDRHRIDAYREQLAHWKQARDDLERRRTNLVRTRERIAGSLQELGWDREEKQALLDAVREREAFLAKLDQEMETVDEELARRVEELRDPDRSRLWFEENKGKLSMPIWKGRIVGRFGTRTHPKFGTRTVHRGLDILPEGFREDRTYGVRAIYWGYVAYAGWLRGLGKTVVVDHTRGYMSLYAHLADIRVKVGEKVKTGGELGTLGDTGSLTGPRLYLELRHDGKAIDPAPWLK